MQKTPEITTLPLRNVIHTHDNRNRSKLDIDFTRLCKFKSSFKHVGMKLYNKLPTTIRDLPINAFGKQLHNLLIDECVYSVKEFKERLN